jgi:predicted ArsR family transcriptional regulator
MTDVRQTILETLNERGAQSLDALARAARHSKMAVRYHLSLLMDEGLIARQEAERRGVVGRPQLRYALAEGGRERLPKQYPQLAEQLLDEIVETMGEKEARTILRRAGRRAAETAPPLRRSAGLEARVARAADFLSARGYMARWEKSNREFILRVCNCPYRQVAREHRQVCEMDNAMIVALLDAPIKMNTCAASDECGCTFTIARSK